MIDEADKDLHEVKTSREFLSLCLYVPVIYQQTSSLFISESYPVLLFLFFVTFVLCIIVFFHTVYKK